MQVGTTKDRGLYNKPSAAVHPGALTARTLPQYNTTRTSVKQDKVKVMNIQVFLYVTPCILVNSDVSEHRSTLFFRGRQSPPLWEMSVNISQTSRRNMAETFNHPHH